MSKLNASVESLIRQFTDDLTFAEVDVQSISEVKSHRNQNRGALTLDEDNVDRMKLAAESGIALPPVVVNKNGAEYVVIDGNHRAKVARLLDRPTITAYVVAVDDDTYKQMCYYFNVANGKSLTPAEIMHHAIAAVENGMQITVAARLYGIVPGTLSTKRLANEGRRKARESGIKGADKISDTAAATVCRFEPEHIKALGQIVAQSTTADLRTAHSVITSTPSSQRETAAIKQAGWLESVYQNRRAPKARKRGVMTQSQLKTSLRKIVVAVRENRALVNDRDVRVLIADLGGMSHDTHSAKTNRN
jgi:hypothetical protein